MDDGVGNSVSFDNNVDDDVGSDVIVATVDKVGD